jgi:hypothetical protein
VLVGLTGVGVLPAAVALAELLEAVTLLDAAAAIPVTAAFGVAALWLARGARRQIERTIGRIGGLRLAKTGRALGVLVLCLAAASAVAIAAYYALDRFAE